jgi:ABC-type uncharacterized transport system substrate-binding protein
VESAAGLSAMRQATPLIPIVFIMVGDPVGSGFVKSLAAAEFRSTRAYARARV